ncbi:T9SS type A sorting domain-containing protein [Aquimarina sp. RZ0]|uniref:T9SS type A sorting domain-containing protein n=1 Tax=Aquimarina sp. RZ0 TaxID=2607730 RepID=UPI0011F37BAC|nr:T9SS type A sorting domain-containing protein [Aquimarina sp. RZ0]KAA1245487.1 T9SS type A sorting domain-containing protein [Aquimarina sp. RZ0]
MKKVFLFTAFCFVLNNLFAQIDTSTQNGPIKKSMILFTQESSATPVNYDQYKADGVFWGHMPNRSIESDTTMDEWITRVENQTSNDKYYFGRGEFDWGWKWMIDFMEDPESNWAKDLNGNNIPWSTESYMGQTHNWQSHHGPEFLEWLKYQVDRMDLSQVTHMMFDSQTSASRTVHWLGGDFSIHSMNGFREYMKEKYTTEELNGMEISEIDSFNYREFLLDKGFTLESYKSQAYSIEGNIPLYKDFVYFQRQALNEVMEELFEYIDTIRPGIAIGATTNLIEPRGYIFSNRMTYLAGEFFHAHETEKSPPFKPILHYKAAEELDKTLIYFPYPDAFKALYDRSAPRQSRGWIAQAYATGSIFTIPGNVWIGGNDTWDLGSENLADLYQFIHNHGELLDDYKAVSNVALAYSVYASLLEGGMDGSITARQTLERLVEENISFDLKIFGDPDRPIAPTAEQLKEYEIVIHDSDVQYFTTEQNQILNESGSNVVSIDNADSMIERLSWKIDVLSENTVRNDLISTFPRISSSDLSAPYVLHLLNRKYNAAEDSAQTHDGISVKIPKDMFGKSIIGAKLHLPGKPSIDLSLQTDDSDIITLDIGTFDACWGIVEFTHDTVLSNGDINPDSETISLYPNPANKYINIRNLNRGGITSIKIFNIQGKQIMSKSIDSNPIDISILPRGIYILKINNSGNTLIKKLIKN